MNFLINVALDMVPTFIVVVFLLVLWAGLKYALPKNDSPTVTAARKCILTFLIPLNLVIGLAFVLTNTSNLPKNTVGDRAQDLQMQKKLNDQDFQKSYSTELKDITRPRTRTSEQLKADHEANVDYRSKK